MPRDTPSHKTTTRALDESHIAEFDHNNGWLAIILLPSSRFNLTPQTVQGLSKFLNAMDASKETSEDLSLEYTADYRYGLLILQKRGLRAPFSVQATQALCEFLNEMLTKSQQEETQ